MVAVVIMSALHLLRALPYVVRTSAPRRSAVHEVVHPTERTAASVRVRVLVIMVGVVFTDAQHQLTARYRVARMFARRISNVKQIMHPTEIRVACVHNVVKTTVGVKTFNALQMLRAKQRVVPIRAHRILSAERVIM